MSEIESLQDRVLTRLRRSPGGAQSAMLLRGLLSDGLVNTGGSLFGGGLGVFPGLTPPGNGDDVTDPIIEEPWYGAALAFVARSAATVPLRIYDRPPHDPKRQEIKDTELNALFDRPNESLSPMELRLHDAIATMIDGESDWILTDENHEPVRTIGAYTDALIDMPARIVPERGGYVTERRESQVAGSRIVGWQVPNTMIARGRSMWPAGALVQLYQQPDHRPQRRGRGLPLIEQMAGPVRNSFFSRLYNLAWSKNFGDPGGVLSLDTWLGDAEFNRLQNQVDESYDPKNAGKPRILEGGAKWEPSRAKPRDMAFEALTEHLRLDMGALTGVSKSLLGHQAENYATFLGHIRMWIFAHLEPMLLAWADRIQTHFVARLRDTRLARLYVGFDLADVKKAVLDPSETGKTVEMFMKAGFSRREALRCAGLGLELDADPIHDELMIGRLSTPMRAAVLADKVKAFKLATEAGFDPEDSAAELQIPMKLDKRFLEARQAEQDARIDAAKNPPEPGAAPAAGGKAPPSAPPAPGKPKAPAAPAKKAAPSMVLMSERTPEAALEQRRVIAALRGPRAAIKARVQSIWRDARNSSVEAVAAFAETGILPEIDRASQPSVRVSRGHLAAYWTAWRADEDERIALEERDASAMVRKVLACDGTTLCEHVADWTPHQDRWLAARPRLAAVGRERLQAMALAARFDLDSDEVEKLLVILAAKWASRVSDVLAEELVVAWEIVEAITVELLEQAGVSVVGLPPATTQDVLDAIVRTKAIQVSEGTMSVLAAKVRRNLIEAIEKGSSAGTLQDRVTESLAEVKAGITRAFNSHRHRALVIARTETAAIANTARYRKFLDMFQRGLLTGHRWTTSGRGPAPLGTVRPTHYAQEGELRVPGQTFSNGLLHPHDPAGPADEVVNCECVLTPETA